MSSKKLVHSARIRRTRIDRSEFAETLTANNMRYQESAALNQKRQEINEHIFGTIKWQ
jgi:hypothetical protein